MKRLISVLFMVVPLSLGVFPQTGSAQYGAGQNPQWMQKMQEMQTCMAGVDQGELKQLEVRARAFEAEIKALCEAGKRTTAMKKAMAFGLEMQNAKAVKQIRRCTEGLGEMMAQMPIPQLPKAAQLPDEEGDSGGHVCDH